MTLESLDRTLYLAIYDKIIDGNHDVDKRLFTSQSEYVQARKNLLDSFGSIGDNQIIYIYGVGPSEKRDETKTTKIVIDRVSSNPGELSSFPEVQLCPNENDKFNKVQEPRGSEDIVYDIRIITSSTKYERICQNIIYQALGSHIKYLETLEGDSIELMRDGFSNASATRLLEYVIRYTAKNVFLEQSTIIQEDIPVLEKIIIKKKVDINANLETHLTSNSVDFDVEDEITDN